MTDAPRGTTAFFQVLTIGYTTSTGPGVAATVSYLADGDFKIIVDPGMVAGPDRILDPLAALGVAPEDITDVVLSHHHPDNTVNAGLFPHARMHDHHAIYHHDQWTVRPAEGYEFTDSIRLIATPGHSPEDITVLAGTPDGVVALAGDLWWRPTGPADDPVAPDRALLRASRERVAGLADLIVPGHGEPFTPGESTIR